MKKVWCVQTSDANEMLIRATEKRIKKWIGAELDEYLEEAGMSHLSFLAMVEETDYEEDWINFEL